LSVADGRTGGELRVWSVPSGDYLGSLPNVGYNSLSVAPDGSRFIVVKTDEAQIWAIDALPR
jgi:sugar lactone lactonase YvrE